MKLDGLKHLYSSSTHYTSNSGKDENRDTKGRCPMSKNITM